MKNIWKYLLLLLLSAGCGTKNAAVKNNVLAPGGSLEKRAVSIVEQLSREHGYHPKKMQVEVKTNADTGDFLIFLFPEPLNMEHLRQDQALFALVNAQSGEVIDFSDPRKKPRR